MADLYHPKGSTEPIEANHITEDNVQAVALWCGGSHVIEKDALNEEITYVAVNVPTSSGVKRAYEDHYVVRLPTGNFDVLTPDQFDAQYDAVARKPISPRERRII